jgi:hypothetical protein
MQTPIMTVLKYKRLGNLGAISKLKNPKTDDIIWRWRSDFTKVLEFPGKDFKDIKEFENWIIVNHR